MDDSGADLQPWEQQPNESPRDYHVFNLFCLMGPERNVRGAAEKWFAETKHPLPKSPGARFNNVAVRWRWQERADAYWIAERRRAERLLRARRDETYARYAALFDRMLAKLETDFVKVKVDGTAKSFVEATLKSLEGHRIAFCDTDEERKHRGRPPEGGPLPSIDDRLKPPEDETNAAHHDD